MPSKSFGETLIKSAARIAEPMAQHDLSRRLARGEEDASRTQERQGHTELARPDGTLIWCHVNGLAEAINLTGIILQMRTEMPEITFLVTTQQRIQDFAFAMRMPEGTLHQYAPLDKSAAVDRFLNHWHPDLCFWVDDVLMPLLNTQTANRGIPAILANLQSLDGVIPRFRWLSSVGKTALRSFRQIFTQNETVAIAVREFGMNAVSVGALCEQTLALSHDESRRAEMARQLQGRPVWLAAKVARGEISDVLDAHRLAARSTHRLVLVVVPEVPDDVIAVHEQCAAKGMVWKDSQDLGDLTGRIDVVVAKGISGLGIWYQMAAVCFLGGSLVPRGGHTPLEAAGLGSAIMHGPNVGNYADIYLRLRNAGAAIEVTSVASLAEAVGELVAPHRAAEMAHAGWVVCSEGADAIDAIVNALWKALPPRAAS
jgi:3-deoxy-D-manno-octulosonic-acid transferase